MIASFKLTLIPAKNLKVGMYIQGHPGWWPVTEVNVINVTLRMRTFTNLPERQVHARFTQDNGMTYDLDVSPETMVLVGIPESY